jgi:hypothetical protein
LCDTEEESGDEDLMARSSGARNEMDANSIIGPAKSAAENVRSIQAMPGEAATRAIVMSPIDAFKHWLRANAIIAVVPTINHGKQLHTAIPSALYGRINQS